MKRKYLTVTELAARMADTYAQVSTFHMTHGRLLDMLTERIYGTDSYKRLTRYDKGYISGYRVGLDNALNAKTYFAYDVAGSVTTFDAWRAANPTVPSEQLGTFFSNNGHFYWNGTETLFF